MVYLGGPRSRRGIRGRGIYLHDPPPGTSCPRPKMPLQDRQRKARQEWAVMRATTVVLTPTAVAFMVIILITIATNI